MLDFKATISYSWTLTSFIYTWPITILNHVLNHSVDLATGQALLCPRPVGGGGIKRSSASVVRLSVCPSVCLMSRTSALTRKPKGLKRRNFAQGYPRSHATPTPTSMSKGQKSRSRDGGMLWRPPSRTACFQWMICLHGSSEVMLQISVVDWQWQWFALLWLHYLLCRMWVSNLCILFFL